MKIFLKGFCIGLLCLSLLGLLWFLVLQPGLTNGEAQALKKEYAQPLPGAESSGVLPAGKEQLEPESLVDLNTICGVPTRENGALPEASFFNGIVPQRAKIPWSTGTT